MEYLALMTRDFKVIKADQEGYLYTASLSSLENLNDIIYLTTQGEGWNLLITEPFISWFDSDTKCARRAFPTGSVTVISSKEEKFCQIQFSDHTYLCVSETGLVTYSRQCAENDERNCFRLLSGRELKILWTLARYEWAIDPLVKTARIADDKSNFHEFYFNDLPVSIDDFISMNRYEENINEFVFLSDRNIYRAVLFNPVFFLVAYGEKALRQLSVTLASLDDPGNYKGKLLVVTDVDRMSVASLLPGRLQDHLEVLSFQAFDTLDFYAARQTVISSGLLEQYSPILYTDIDVMMTLPMEKTLCQGALERWFSAQREEWVKGADFRYMDSAGKLFFSQDPFPVEKREAGFNSGAFFVPLPARNKAYMDMAFLAHMLYAGKKGRKIPFPEQQILNYALRKLEAVDCDLVTRLTEVGGNPHSEIVQFHGGMDVKKARGIIHYWCTSVSDRSPFMAKYLQRLRNYRKTLKVGNSGKPTR